MLSIERLPGQITVELYNTLVQDKLVIYCWLATCMKPPLICVGCTGWKPLIPVHNGERAPSLCHPENGPRKK